MHVDLVIIPTLREFLLASNSRDFVIESLDEFVKGLCRQLDEG